LTVMGKSIRVVFCAVHGGGRNVWHLNDDKNFQPIALHPDRFEAAADWKQLASPENFLGYSRTEGLESSGVVNDKRVLYSVPPHLVLNQWALFRRVDHGKGKCLPK
jgi:hypothetical protein